MMTFLAVVGAIALVAVAVLVGLVVVSYAKGFSH